MKNFLIFIMAGSLLGVIFFGWFSPQLISWYFTPPAELAFSCKPAMEWGMGVYQKVIATGLIMGAIAFALLFFAVCSFRNKNQAGPKESSLLP
jgi:hypothetical protein